MKRLILLVLMACGIGTSAQAQTQSRELASISKPQLPPTSWGSISSVMEFPLLFSKPRLRRIAPSTQETTEEFVLGFVPKLRHVVVFYKVRVETVAETLDRLAKEHPEWWLIADEILFDRYQKKETPIGLYFQVNERSSRTVPEFYQNFWDACNWTLIQKYNGRSIRKVSCGWKFGEDSRFEITGEGRVLRLQLVKEF